MWFDSGGNDAENSGFYKLISRYSHQSPDWVTRDLVTISFCVFFSAMGANAFNQYVIPYLTTARGWSVGKATFMVAATFALIPLVRFNYPRAHRLLGDRGALALGNTLFLVYLVLIIYADGPLASVAMAATMALGVGLVFSAAPLQIYDATPLSRKGKASGYFLGSNFLAWFVGNVLYNVVIRRIGFEATPYWAMFISGLGILSLGLIPRRFAIRPVVAFRTIVSHSKNPQLRTVALFMALSAASIGLMFGIFAQFTAQTYGPAMTAVLVLGFYLARLPGSLGTGFLADRWGLMPILVGVSLVTGLSLIFSGLYQFLPIFFVATIVLGLQQSAVPVAAMTLAGSVLEPGSRHQIHAFIFTISELTVSLALLISYLLSSSLTDLRVVFPTFGVLYMASAVIAFYWMRSHRQTQALAAGN